jgi:hypothetical protein
MELKPIMIHLLSLLLMVPGGNIGATVFNITVTPQNDNPVLVTNTGKTVNEGATNQTILTAELQTTDADNTPVQLTYTLTAVPTNGTLDIGGPALGIGGTLYPE